MGGAPRDPLETLAGAFGVRPQPGADLPSAALCLSAVSRVEPASVCWYHADPVHLRADRDRLLLFAGPGLGVSAEEAAALAEAFNAQFAPDGLALRVPHPGRWYLQVRERPDLQTRPLHSVVGRPLEALLPSGRWARAWSRWQTETQMLFHAHPVNAERERRGRPLLSGLWTWGGGTLPKVTQGPDLMIADHPLALGLAATAGTPVAGLGALDAADHRLIYEPERGSVLVFWDRAWWPALEGGQGAWADAIATLETRVRVLLSDLESARIRSLTIDDGASLRLALTRGALRRFWRHRGGFSDWMKRVRVD